MGSKINRDWHVKHKMPKNPTFEQRVSWHLAHQKNCACRPIAGKLAEEMTARGIKYLTLKDSLHRTNAKQQQ